MTPAARLQASIELLDAIIVAARDGGAAADTLIARYFAARRYAGSKDRRAVRELIYDAIRMLGERPESGRAAMLALSGVRPELKPLFGVGGHAPLPIEAGEAVARPGVLPKWLADHLDASGIDVEGQAALLERAPLDLRVNRLKADRPAVVDALPDFEPLDWLPDAVRSDRDVVVDATPLFRSGAVEIQDAGSQLVTLASGVEPGMRVVDLCAGAGGKTLALAAMMANRGELVACDIDRGRLSRLAPRAERAGVSIATTRLLNPGKEADALADLNGTMDLVFVDAPCSGTGTWRRNPEARWRLTPARLDRLAETQSRLLDLAAEMVRPGGAVVHVVCSLLDAEGRDQAEAFLARQPAWQVARIDLPRGDPHGPGLRLTPHRHSTDGFFVAKMVRPC